MKALAENEIKYAQTYHHFQIFNLTMIEVIIPIRLHPFHN